MSYLFSLDPLAEANHDERARMNPAGPMAAPWVTLKTPLGALAGLAQGFAETGYVADEWMGAVGTPIARDLDKRLGTDMEGWLAENTQKARQAVVDHVAPDPYMVGRAGEIAAGVTKGLAEAAGGFFVGGPVGAYASLATVEGMTTFRRLRAQGVDEETALTAATQHGAFAGAGAVIPMALPGSLARSMLFGAGVGFGTGAAEKATLGHTLESAGYTDIAEQYRHTDATSIAIDVILGGAFGAWGHAMHGDRRPTVGELGADNVDAALAANTGRHVDAIAPGIPADIATRNAHLDALVKATEDLLQDHPVDVTDKIGAAHLVPDPGQRAYLEEVLRPVEQAHGPAIAEAQQLQAETATSLVDEAAVAPAPSLDSIRAEIGWAQRGGQIIRAGADPEALARGEISAQGEVVGRTPWIPVSDFWPGRPDKSLSEKDAHAAIDKATAGEQLRAKEARFVDYAHQVLTERGAIDEAARLEGNRERTAIQSEQEPTIADPDLVAAGYLKLAPDERIAVERWLAYASELEAQRGEIDRLAAEQHSQQVPGGHGTPDTGTAQAGPRNDQQGQPGAGRESGGQGNADQAQELDRLRQIAETNPDLRVALGDGTTLSVPELLARAAMAADHDAETVRLIETAIACALRNAA